VAAPTVSPLADERVAVEWLRVGTLRVALGYNDSDLKQERSMMEAQILSFQSSVLRCSNPEVLSSMATAVTAAP
jgi:hypothetical protein